VRFLFVVMIPSRSLREISLLVQLRSLFFCFVSSFGQLQRSVFRPGCAEKSSAVSLNGVKRG